jgi:hypothetical protein
VGLQDEGADVFEGGDAETIGRFFSHLTDPGGDMSAEKREDFHYDSENIPGMANKKNAARGREFPSGAIGGRTPVCVDAALIPNIVVRIKSNHRAMFCIVGGNATGTGCGWDS